jgi:hypothetical protein
MAANREQGVGEIVVDGKAYRLKIGMNALCLLEDELNMSATDVMAEFASRSMPRMFVLRGIMWAALQEFHAAEFTNARDVGTFIDRAGGVEPAMRALGTMRALPDAEPQTQEGGDVAALPKVVTADRLDGIGPASSSAPLKRG